MRNNEGTFLGEEYSQWRDHNYERTPDGSYEHKGGRGIETDERRWERFRDEHPFTAINNEGERSHFQTREEAYGFAGTGDRDDYSDPRVYERMKDGDWSRLASDEHLLKLGEKQREPDRSRSR